MSPSSSDAGRSRDRCRRCSAASPIEADGGSRPAASLIESGSADTLDPGPELCSECYLRGTIMAFLR
ncbi:hypothetical protein BRC77_00890 [Halobacteriales archaeon QH_8_64_26]|nr:MAG: hypothetical protein BRC77_00890 [Halobacteriales archaeon QH_8_64_26]